MWEGAEASPVPLFIHFRPRLPEEPSQARRQPCSSGRSWWRVCPQGRGAGGSGQHCPSSQGEVRPSPGSAAHVSTHPCRHSGLSPLWSLGPPQTGQPQACGQGRLSAPQEGTFPLQGRPRPAAPTTMLVLGSKSHDDTPAPPPAQRHPPQPRPHPDCPLLYSTLGPGQRGYLHGRKV